MNRGSYMISHQIETQRRSAKRYTLVSYCTSCSSLTIANTSGKGASSCPTPVYVQFCEHVDAKETSHVRLGGGGGGCDL